MYGFRSYYLIFTDTCVKLFHFKYNSKTDLSWRGNFNTLDTYPLSWNASYC